MEGQWVLGTGVTSTSRTLRSIPGFDFSEYDDAFLSAERTVQQRLAAGESPPTVLGPRNSSKYRDDETGDGRKSR